MFPVRHQGFTNEDLLFFIDRRSLFFHSLSEARQEFLWHFPMTNEFFKIRGEIVEETADEERERLWNSLSQREKMSFCGIPPDVEVENARIDEMDKFNPQEARKVSQNFAVLKIVANFVEHSRFLDRSAIGNTRKTFESLPQPDAVSQRWIHRKVEGIWSVKEVALSIVRP
jgi:hypothetical protein